jgi:hypothetical protein
LLSITKKGDESDELAPEGSDSNSALIPKEGTGLTIFFGKNKIIIYIAILASMSFGFRGLILKYMGMKLDIDGISASIIFLMTDGLTGGIIGLIITLNGGAYADFPPLYIFLGLLSGCLAGTGVLCLNIAIMTGLSGPAVALANSSR